jgi:hypothetical protein
MIGLEVLDSGGIVECEHRFTAVVGQPLQELLLIISEFLFEV